MPNTMLSRRQINVQRDNLISICRISVKALIDYACLNTHIDDACEEFINFCAVFEHLVSHRLRPNQKKVWLPRPGPPTPRHFWDVLLDAQSRAHSLYFQSCVPNIDAIESFKSPQAKLRAFLRVALMEKRLSDYIMWVLDHQLVLRNHYLDGAVMLTEQAAVLCGDLIGLNAIDFNFCLKGNENEFLGPLEISYSKFLCYKQSAESRSSDEIEMIRLNQALEDDDGEDDSLRGKSPDNIQAGSILSESNVNDILRLQQLERDFYSIKEQKDYLEELARLRERQVSETNARLDGVKAELIAQKQEWDRERHTMDSCILELQADITKLFQQNERLRFQVASYRQFKDRLNQRDVPLDEMAMGRQHQEEEGSGKLVVVSISSGTPHHKCEGSQLSSDLRSLQSTGSDSIWLREDSHSMVPLTGSLAGDNGSGLDSGPKDQDPGSKPEGWWEPDSVPDDGAPHPPLSSQPEAETIMMESFVMTENRSDIETAVKQALACHSGAEQIVTLRVDVVDNVADELWWDGAGFVKDKGDEKCEDCENKVLSNDDGGCSTGAENEDANRTGTPRTIGEQKDLAITSEPDELAVTSEPENLAVTSEPEELAVTSEPEELNVTSEPEE
ncbi:hypothetical protein EGW08_015247, partial [Elysia chlorotica]